MVLVGDDRQLAAIDAGGGFRALRLRLGASELVENRRQHQAWEREALELVRDGLVDEAVAAYRDHDRLVAAETKSADPGPGPGLVAGLAGRPSGTRPRSVIMLAGSAARSTGSTRICQQLMADHGRLGPERLQVGDRQLAVGDRVVCGRNALAQLGVANGTRGTVTALDARARTLTIRARRQGRPRGDPARLVPGRPPARASATAAVDLAYATTGHRAQGLTRWRALVRLTGREDANWLYVQLSRARHDTTLYAQVGPEPQGPASWTCPTGSWPTATSSSPRPIARRRPDPRDGHPGSLDLRRLSTRGAAG